ncbi:E3 ubiquitin-protein ligase rnf8 [Eumeta japonica]|uniref:E3 ubiquitin-protein ligase CHFR n=1 Tax=Eumeta variegata TaxID=151549 RepID=A0A4C1VRY4_EUMVA|nr:E3 ubiquitin-protein ligase rnf8 [Eumeta japonica]
MEEKFPSLITTKTLKPEFKHLERIPISCNEFSIGRGLDNDLNISYLALSRKHCKFKKTENDEWTFEDLSTFGIKLNGKSLIKGCTHTLHSNDIIALDVCNEFEYKFVVPEEEPPKKLRKIDEISSDTVCEKFKESQNYEIQLMENKIHSTQQLQYVSLERKRWLNLELKRNVQHLEDEYSLQIENLKGEKKEIEMQKLQLEQERDAQIVCMKQEMDSKLSELMEKIKEHYTKEAALLRENSILKERLMRERNEFLLKLNKENSSKQDMLVELEEKIRKQEIVRMQEKQLLENALREETEQLRITKEKYIVRQGCVASPWLFNLFMNSCLYDLKEYENELRIDELFIKSLLYADNQGILGYCSRNLVAVNVTKTKVMVELKDLEEKKKLREKELELALEHMKTLLENQLEQTKLKQIEAEQQLHQKTEEINKIKEHDKTKMEELVTKDFEARNIRGRSSFVILNYLEHVQYDALFLEVMVFDQAYWDRAREDAEKKLAEAQIRAIKSEEELQKKMKEREIELATLAADRIQLQAEQSNEVIYNLQKQLEVMRSQLQTMEERNNTVEVAEYIEVGETSKESALAEVGALMESELQCSICAELLVHPVTLGCSHTFCHYCITRWRQKSNNCPNCRVTIKSDAKSLAIETFIEKMVKNLSDDMKKKREEMLKEREAEAHRILAETYGDNALSDTTRRDWFRFFKNNDFELYDEERSGAPETFEDEKLEELLHQNRRR